jgi:hypothetical protein
MMVVNVYGDETTFNMQYIANAVLKSGTDQFKQGYYSATGTYPSQAQINGFLSTNPKHSPFMWNE